MQGIDCNKTDMFLEGHTCLLDVFHQHTDFMCDTYSDLLKTGLGHVRILHKRLQPY